MTNEAVAAIGAACVAVGALGQKIVDRYKRRDELDAGQATATIKKLWAQVDAQQAEIRDLRVELDRCKDGHRDARSEPDALRRDVEDLRQELDELRMLMKGAG